MMVTTEAWKNSTAEAFACIERDLAVALEMSHAKNDRILAYETVLSRIESHADERLMQLAKDVLDKHSGRK
ncbi:MAG: hypothetical protein ACRENE_15200 [Polyangiaceae bacterium]